MNNNQNGMTMIELLVVLAIIMSVFLFSSFVFSERQPQVSLDTSSGELMSVLRLAQSQSISLEASSSWGVYFDLSDNGAYVLYAGESYAERNDIFSRIYNLGEGIYWDIGTTSLDLNFSHVNGFSSSTTTIEIRHQDIPETGIIEIDEFGKIERND